MALLKKKAETVPYKLTLNIEKSLAQRLERIEKMAEQGGYEFDLSAGLADSLAHQIARAEKILAPESAETA